MKCLVLHRRTNICQRPIPILANALEYFCLKHRSFMKSQCLKGLREAPVLWVASQSFLRLAFMLFNIIAAWGISRTVRWSSGSQSNHDYTIRGLHLKSKQSSLKLLNTFIAATITQATFTRTTLANPDCFNFFSSFSHLSSSCANSALFTLNLASSSLCLPYWSCQGCSTFQKFVAWHIV